MFDQRVRRSVRRRRPLAATRRAGRRDLRLGETRRTCAGRRTSSRSRPGDLVGARALVRLGDSVTTDHISPAGAIPPDSVAGRYLRDSRVPAGAEHLCVPPGQPPGDGAWRLRQPPAAQRACRRHRRSGHPGPDGVLTSIYDGGRGLPGGRRTDRRCRGQGIRHRFVAGLGGQGPGAARSAGGTRAVVRADPSVEPGRPRHPAAGVPARRGRRPHRRGAIDIELGDDGFATARSAGKTYRLRIRLDTPREHDYYRHGGVLPYVLHRLSEGQTQ